MAIYFVDSTTGSDTSTGLTLDTAWATVEHAVEAGGLSAGDFVAVRRTHSETPTSDVECLYDGEPGSPITVFGCPRDTVSITSATWTNGSATVSSILPASMTRESHCGRRITAPDGETYLITKISSSTGFLIDREYPGATVTLTDGASTIQADDVESAWDNYDDSGDTIKKADWETDGQDLPQFDFNDGAYRIAIASDNYWVFKNFDLIDSAAQGFFYANAAYCTSIIGCIMQENTSNRPLMSSNGSGLYMERCIMEGSGSGTSQRGFYQSAYGFLHMKDCALYNLGDNGFHIRDFVFLENVNCGVEAANGDNEIQITFGGAVWGRDVKLGGSNGYAALVTWIHSRGGRSMRFAFENYQKVLGSHRAFYPGGYFENVAVSGETPDKKVSDTVMKITPNVNVTPISDWAFDILTHEIEVPAGTHTFKYWIYNDSGSTLNDATAKDNIWLKAEYIKAYDDTSEYVMAEAFSTEIDILDAANASDWDYLQTTVTTAAEGLVRLTIYFSFYDASNNIFIDPAVVIS